MERLFAPSAKLPVKDQEPAWKIDIVDAYNAVRDFTVTAATGILALPDEQKSTSLREKGDEARTRLIRLTWAIEQSPSFAHLPANIGIPYRDTPNTYFVYIPNDRRLVVTRMQRRLGKAGFDIKGASDASTSEWLEATSRIADGMMLTINHR